MVKTTGKVRQESINDMNIPVDIWIVFNDVSKKYVLKAANYMPRKEVVLEGAFEFEADTREELVEIVKNKIIPLYQKALNKLDQIVEGKADNLYYWE